MTTLLSRTGVPWHLAGCAVRAVVATLAVLVLALGLGLLLWAVTPEAGQASSMLRAAVGALGAAEFLPPTIGGTSLTLAPLLFTAVCVVAVASAALRGGARGAMAELGGAIVVGVVHGGVVLILLTALATDSTGFAGREWAPFAMGLVSALGGVCVRGPSLRTLWRSRVPYWTQVGARSGLVATLVVIAGGAVGLAAALIRSFGTAIDLGSMVAPSLGASMGVLLLSLAFLPNAVIAGAGYSVGVGFQIGHGTFGPWRTTAVDLPALPLLAAVPDGGGFSPSGAVLLVFPLLAAVLVGRSAVRGSETRSLRIASALVGAAVTAVGCAALAIVTAGGVSGSPWAHLWVPVLAVAGVVFGGVGGIAVAIAAVAGWTQVPWSEHSDECPQPSLAPRSESAARPEAPEQDGTLDDALGGTSGTSIGAIVVDDAAGTEDVRLEGDDGGRDDRADDRADAATGLVDARTESESGQVSRRRKARSAGRPGGRARRRRH